MSKNGSKSPTRTKKSVYTPFGYGYIEVLVPPESKPVLPEAKQPEEDKKGEASSGDLLVVHLKNGATVSMQSSMVKTKVKLCLKTFHGSRKVYDIETEITDTIEKLRTRLIALDEDKELASCKQIRLIHTIGKIKDLPSSSTIEYLEIPENSVLVVIGLKTFTWDTAYKGADIELLNGNATANKKQIQDYETVLGAVGFSTGRHYWEIKIDAMIDLEDIFVGIAVRDINLVAKPTEGQTYWGYICCAAKAFSPKDEQTIDYGEMCTVSDMIGVLLEFSNDQAQLTFYRNKKSLGVAFAGIPSGVYYPAATLFYSGVKVTLNTNVPVPVENSPPVLFE